MLCDWIRRQMVRSLVLASLSGGIALTGCGTKGSVGAAPETQDALSAPTINSIQPSRNANAVVGDRVQFVVVAQSTDHLSYRWTVDGVNQPVIGERLVLDTGNHNTAYHTVTVDVIGQPANVTSVVWRLQLVSPESNSPPTIESVFPTAAITLVKGEKSTFTVIASDPDAGDEVSYSWNVNDEEQAESEGSYQLDTTSMDPGNYTVTAVVYDSHIHPESGVVSVSFPVTVTAAPVANRPPVINSATPTGSISIVAGSSLNLSVSASDPDGDALTYRWTVDGNVQGGSSSSFQYAPGDEGVGSHAIVVSADDGKTHEGASLPAHSWTVTVTPVVPPPPPDPGPQGNVVLAWNPVTVDSHGNPVTVSGYRVYLAQTPGGFQEPAMAVLTPQATLDLDPGVTYYVAVTAFDADELESEFSDSITVQVQ
jgi:hypothetical protein